MTWVKICGTTNLRDAQLSVVAGADALGFIFAPSPRQVEIEAATEIIAAIAGRVETIGIFVDESPERIAEVATRAGLSGVQLHGDEPASMFRQFRCALGNRKIVKTLHARELVKSTRMLAECLLARDSIDAILLDSGSPQQRGGTGTQFAWNDALPIAAEIRRAMPLIIAGGLNADNVRHAIELFDPWGIDVVSGVEGSPGNKDEGKLLDFMAAVRQTQASARQRE